MEHEIPLTAVRFWNWYVFFFDIPSNRLTVISASAFLTFRVIPILLIYSSKYQLHINMLATMHMVILQMMDLMVVSMMVKVMMILPI